MLAEQDARISVFRNDINRGAYFTRNRGLFLATGKFVTVMDADDWAHPQKIEKQVLAAYLAGEAWRPLYRIGQDVITRWNLLDLGPQSGWVHRNVSSLMVHRQIALELGGLE